MPDARRSAVPALFLSWVLATPALLPWPALASTGGPLAALGGSGEAADPQAKALQENQDAIAQAREAAARLRAERETLEAEVAAAPSRLRRLEAELKADAPGALAAWRARIPADADVDVLERLLEQERREAERLSDRITRLTRALGAALAPSDEPRQDLESLRAELDSLSGPVAAGENEAAPVLESRRERQAAERERVEAELALREAEAAFTATRQRLQDLELRVLRRQLAQQEPRLLFLQERIVEQSRARLQALVEDIDARAAAIGPEEPLLAEQAATNLALAGDLLAANEQLADHRSRLALEEQALAEDQAALRDTRTRIELGGRSEQVGTWLWAVVRRLEDPDVLADRLEEARQALAESRLRLIALDEQQRSLVDIPELAEALHGSAGGGDEDEAGGTTDRAALEAWLVERVDLAARLEALLWRTVATLEQRERGLQSRLQATRELRQLLDRHLLWIRSHASVDREWLGRLPTAGQDLVKPSRLATTGRLMAKRVGEILPLVALAVLIWLGALALRLMAPARLEAAGQVVRDAREDRYARTLVSLAWTVVAALPLAVALWLGGTLLQDVGERGKYSDSLGMTLHALVLPAFTLAFLAWLVRDRGLAHVHFRWTRQRREALQAVMRWLPWVLLPLYFVVALGFERGQELAVDVSGRLAAVAAALLGAATLAWLLAPDRAWHGRGARTRPSRTRRALRVLLPLGLLACASLALQGYVYSSAMLLNAMFASVGVITAVAVAVGLLGRWFALGERRLALRRQEQKREAEAQAEAEPAPPEDGGEAILVDVDEDLALDKVSVQSQRLLRAVRWLLLVAGLVWVWGDVLPAFARLDEVALWTINQTAADGSPSTTSITLMAALLGVLALALTVVAARNLPGLLEIGLLSKVNMDAASRYAITSVSRYAIVMVGIVVGLGLLGLRWGQLQWLVAALTVGLGFGLQEIFANFVSGLILLFERPFRVGDVITVNNLDGTVTRIRTRATTILDFDNKEIVVPNKTFITGQLVNWTLSDETTRITIKVGVEYGSDPRKVHQLLLQAAEENDRVLDNPAPRSWLLDFGANSLDFELRIFVGGIGDRLAVRDELNVRLTELFAEHGIGFAFPQLDLHVRELPEAPGRGRGPVSADERHEGPDAPEPG